MTSSSAYELDIPGGTSQSSQAPPQQSARVATTGSGADETLKASVEGPLEAAFEAASRANGRFDHVVTREQRIDRQAIASAITIEDEASFTKAAEAYAVQNSAPVGSAHRQPEPADLPLPQVPVQPQIPTTQSPTQFGAWIGSTAQQAAGGMQWETAPAIPSLEQQWETAPSIPKLELPPAPENPSPSKPDQSPSKPDQSPSKPNQSPSKPNQSPSKPGYSPSKSFTTTGNLRKMESQKLRCMDDYEKPEDVCIRQWLRTATRELFARQSIKFITRLYGANDARLLPHLDRLAELQHRRRYIDDAERLHARALSLREQHFGRTHSSCAINLTGLARIWHDQGRYAQAEDLFREAIRLHENAFRKLTFLSNKGLVNTGEQEQALVSFLDATNQLAQMLAEQGKFIEAKQEYELALEAWNTFPAEASQSVHTLVATVLQNYRQVETESNRASGASASGKQTLVLLHLE